LGLPSTQSSKELTSTVIKQWKRESSTTWTLQAGEQATVRSLLDQLLFEDYIFVESAAYSDLAFTFIPCLPYCCSV
jgi:hypothetical protein